MTRILTPKPLVALIGAVSLAAVAACSSDEGEDGTIEITWLTSSDEQTSEMAAALIEEFEATHSGIVVNHDTRPSGDDGVNVVKTRLATGEMAEVFTYNSGSLLQALNPDATLVDLSEEAWIDNLTEDFRSVVSTESGVYGTPFGTSLAGGIVYSQPVYDELGLEVPQSWDAFMANNEQIAAAGYVPIIQTYADPWTSQLFVLGDFANVHAQDSEWAQEYTAHSRFYAEEPALAGFRHLQEAYEAGYFNVDFPSATFEDGAMMVADGTGAHYPILTTVLDTITANSPDAVEDLRFMAIPADSAQHTSATIWQPDATYVAATAEGEERAAALQLLTFLNSSDACDIVNETGAPSGPYANSCELPDDVTPLLQDVQAYVDEGNTAPALEFLSPIKGPNLANITVEVGSGIRSAEEAAANYDRDVENQARQLDLDGW
ncbi:ABC transporter substrate-binding protein [Ruania alba]|uniref:Raffinose/stachyose/melibiose transport system substrate-binding protein n=1 Tax=Ruania alba TaxID=648782 RepID=A0A1H5LAT7_9MICO|nr:ABC transporter substrate-binding protein [Ruania alba]SEE74090.1 raffinose/stachyose/melibiose transport system substrate-binding protein [Ruania alba]